MSFLIDTHALLWYIDGRPLLSKSAEQAIRNEQTLKFVSIATLWEIAIKSSLNKLQLTIDFETFPQFLDLNNFNILPIDFLHLLEIKKLQFHHGDPFDRLLIAQAIAEDLTVISADRHFESYPVKVLW